MFNVGCTHILLVATTRSLDVHGLVACLRAELCIDTRTHLFIYLKKSTIIIARLAICPNIYIRMTNGV